MSPTICKPRRLEQIHIGSLNIHHESYLVAARGRITGSGELSGDVHPHNTLKSYFSFSTAQQEIVVIHPLSGTAPQIWWSVGIGRRAQADQKCPSGDMNSCPFFGAAGCDTISIGYQMSASMMCASNYYCTGQSGQITAEGEKIAMQHVRGFTGSVNRIRQAVRMGVIAGWIEYEGGQGGDVMGDHAHGMHNWYIIWAVASGETNLAAFMKL
ncbi:hypothetical protein HD554DRAFT_2040350 [Boletus coccyginus]|nr:hypothetical protein HD554DRAFT_2040350 [Boletus coccyginus]